MLLVSLSVIRLSIRRASQLSTARSASSRAEFGTAEAGRISHKSNGVVAAMSMHSITR